MWQAGPIMKTPRGRHNSRSRRFSEAAINIALRGGWIAKLSYSCGLHGTLRVTAYDMRIPAQKRLPAPLVLAFASDFHAGPTTYPQVFATLVEELIARKPDALLLGGDYVTGEADSVAELSSLLSRCEPPLGKYAVLGNHDLWTDDAHIQRQLQAAGATVLINGNRPLPAPFDNVSVCGIDDPWTGRVDVAKTFAGAGPIRIFLTHSPDGLLFLKNERYDIGFAGHTHGGQVAFPNGTPVLSACGPLSRTYGRGRFEVAAHGPLIVGRGIGCSNLPIRLNADPELIICTLHPWA
jgi:hypothetical protein